MTDIEYASVEELRLFFRAAEMLKGTTEGVLLRQLAVEVGREIGGSRQSRKPLATGAKLGDPWVCGRCRSKNTRAVLAHDKTPGCTRCKNQSGLDVMLRNVYAKAYKQFAFQVSDGFSWFKKPEAA